MLGTASQVPTRHRNHNGYLLRWDGVGFLFDPGEGTQRQLILADPSMSGVHHVCITHFHGDHCLGLPGVLQRASLDGLPHPLQVHFHESGQPYVDRLRYASIYQERAVVEERPFATGGTIAEAPTWTLSCAALDHTTPSFGYRLDERAGWTLDPARLAARGLRGPQIGALQREGSVEIDGQRVTTAGGAPRRPGQAVAVVMDTRPCAGALQLAQGVDLLVCESTYLGSHQAEARQRGHMTAADAGRLAAQAGAKALLLTHFSQRVIDEQAFVDEAAPHFAGPITAARDGLALKLRG